MESQFIVNTNESDFEQQVIQYSYITPVLVDFWASWCVPCRTLEPILIELAIAGNGSFRLARLNVDENPNLSRRYDIRSVPSVKVIKDGVIVAEFVGVLTKEKLVRFLSNIIIDEWNLYLEKGNSLINLGKYSEAEVAFRELLSNSPDHDQALLGLSISLMHQDRYIEAERILDSFPESKSKITADFLHPFATALSQFSSDGPHPIDPTDPIYLDDPQLIYYDRAIYLFWNHNYPAGIDGLLEILKNLEPDQQGNIKELILAALELMGADDPDTRRYRNELASYLF